MIAGMNHFTSIACDAQGTLDLYVDVLGPRVDHRRYLSLAGAWLYPGDPHFLLHL
jgi:catechol 2,3-dioxygenase-like lactoylglutathione lyase family enzyme